ncbi:MAG: glycerol-3-phosphate acyltransferase [Chloroflexota bacterium]
MNLLLPVLAGAAIGYFLGAIPFGLLAGRLARKGDLREYGSGKTGFTNALRTLGLRWALFVILGDVLKGTVAVLIGRYLIGEPAAAAAAGFAAVFGHVFPVYAGFRGGRGVATAFGAFLGVSPPAALALALCGAAILAIWRYASLMSVTGVAAGLVVIGVMTAVGRLDPAYALLFAVPTATLVEVSHIPNIRRLLAGTEPKLGQGGTRRVPGAS